MTFCVVANEYITIIYIYIYNVVKQYSQCHVLLLILLLIFLMVSLIHVSYYTK